MFKKIVATAALAGVAVVSTVALGSCGNKSIDFYTQMNDSKKAALQPALDKWEEKYGYTVNFVQYKNYNEIKSAITPMLAGGDLPAMADCYTDHVADYKQSGKVLDINKYLNDPDVGLSQEEINDFIPVFWNEGETAFGDNKQKLVLPFAKSTEALYINEDIVTRTNWTATDGTKVPKTWDDMWSFAEAVMNLPENTDNDDTNNIAPFGVDSIDNLFIQLAYQRDIPYTAHGEKHYLFDNDEAAELITELQTHKKAGHFITRYDIKADGTGYTSDWFKQGKLAISIGSTGGASHQVPNPDDGEEVFDINVAPFPNSKVGEELKGGSIFQGPSIVLFDQGDEELNKMIFDLAMMMLEPEVNAEFSKVSGYMPVRQSVIDIESYNTWLNSDDIIAKTTKMALDAKETYFLSPAFAGSSQARTEVGAVMKTVLTDQNKTYTKDEILRLLQDAVKKCEALETK